MAEDSRQQIPTSLGDVIRRHRDLFEVGLATADELAAIDGSLDTGAPADATLDDWWAVALRDLAEDRFLLMFYGENAASGKLRRTSAARAIDLERGLLQTQDALYALGEPTARTPPFELIFDVCAELHRRGLGDRYGVPKAWE